MKLAFVVLLCLCFGAVHALNNQPIIGVLGLPIVDGCDSLDKGISQEDFLQSKAVKENPKLAAANSCFTSVYVKWLEMAGARVVPIRFDAPEHELAHLYESLNGLLYTGGGLSLDLNTTFVQTALSLFKLALSAKDYFPVWGTCQGFQLLNVLASLDPSVVVPGFDSEDISYPLIFNAETDHSYLFSSLPRDIVEILRGQPVTMNFHQEGVTPEAYKTNTKLSSFYTILTTNTDRKGREFISTIEAKHYPIFATQWHPERQQFEFNSNDPGFNHDYDAIRAMQAVGNFFVNQAKKNSRTFANQTEEFERLIYNYNPVYQGAPGSTEYYYF